MPDFFGTNFHSDYDGVPHSHSVVVLAHIQKRFVGFLQCKKIWRVCSSRVECASNRCIQFDFRDTGT